MTTTFGQLQFGGDVIMRTLHGIGQITIGAQNRISVIGFALAPASTPVNIDIDGFYRVEADGTLTAQAWVITGPDSDAAAGGPIVEQFYPFWGAVNDAGPLVIQPSVASTSRIFYRNI